MRKDDVTYVRVTREIYTPVCVYSIYCIYIYKRERERRRKREGKRNAQRSSKQIPRKREGEESYL